MVGKSQPRSKSSSNKVSSHKSRPLPFLIAYYLYLLFVVLATVLPEYRLWGAASLAYTPAAFTGIWFLVAVAAPPLLWKWAGTLTPEEQIGDHRSGWILATVLLSIIGMVSFIVGRGASYLLGDGQALLANVAKANPVTKPREIGAETLVHYLKSLVGSNSPEGALRTYQIFSWSWGGLYLICSALFCHKVLGRSKEGFFLFVTLLVSGSSLLFFGYVENYAPLAVSIALFCFVGMMITQGRLPKWSIVLPFGLAVFFHIVAAVLALPAAFIIFRETPMAKRISELTSSAKMVLIAILCVSCIVVLAIWSRIDIFVRFALVPFSPDRFTVAGYTLFSPSHLGDFVNLVLMLCPAFVIYCVAAVRCRRQVIINSPDLQFLGLAALAMLAAAFILDPKLGMARDWDLFSFPAIPLTLFGSLLVLRSHSLSSRPVFPLLLACALGIVALIPRILVQHQPAMGSAYAERCMLLDKEKNRTSLAMLEDYYKANNDSADARRVSAIRKVSFPQDELLWQVKSLLDAGSFSDARNVLAEAESFNPSNHEYWSSLARYYLQTRQYDSALVAAAIADGLNPYSPNVLDLLGGAYAGLGDLAKARDLYERAVSIDSTHPPIIWRLANVYKDLGEGDLYRKTLMKAASLPGARNDIVKEACAVLIGERKFVDASKFLTGLMQRGSDTVYVDSIKHLYPQLTL